MSTSLSLKRSSNESRRLGAVGVVTFPLVSAGLEPLMGMTDVIYPITDGMFVITGGAGSALLAHRTYDRCVVDSVDHKGGRSAVMRILHFTATQCKIISKLVRRAKFVSFWLFYQGGDYMLLPMVVAKLSKKPIVLVLSGSQINIMSAQKDPLTMSARWLIETTMWLADRITVFSPRLIEEWNLGNVEDRVVFLHHPIEFDEVSVTPLVERKTIVGYVGRFSEEKGPLEFVEAISLVLERDPEVRFHMIGEGRLREQVEATLASKRLNDRVKLMPWVPHEQLPQYLSELKLLVIPSYTEGIPNIMIEAMLCETPVLSTKVGSAPVYIQDGVTGFLMETNEPQCIAKNVIRALHASNSEELVKKAHHVATANFSLEAVREGWWGMLHDLLDERETDKS
jgi:glycosyltransferase involved in cell wall biosynthesis